MGWGWAVGLELVQSCHAHCQNACGTLGTAWHHCCWAGACARAGVTEYPDLESTHKDHTHSHYADSS